MAYLGVLILLRKLFSSLIEYAVRCVHVSLWNRSTMNNRCSQKCASPGMSAYWDATCERCLGQGRGRECSLDHVNGRQRHPSWQPPCQLSHRAPAWLVTHYQVGLACTRGRLAETSVFVWYRPNRKGLWGKCGGASFEHPRVPQRQWRLQRTWRGVLV